uniref:Uncharacterized protein n=1 Tax=Rhizophora mucronata TaxID=61149 RepID=A0A2P2NE70_RHIMU
MPRMTNWVWKQKMCWVYLLAFQNAFSLIKHVYMVIVDCRHAIQCYTNRKLLIFFQQLSTLHL